MQALQRLRMPAWPYRGAVALVEDDAIAGRRELHLLDRWRYLGSVLGDSGVDDWAADAAQLPRFDVDIFRQLRRALGRGTWRVRELAGAAR